MLGNAKALVILLETFGSSPAEHDVLNLTQSFPEGKCTYCNCHHCQPTGRPARAKVQQRQQSHFGNLACKLQQVT
eukprot:248129-Amphidinium_carterae.1